MGSFEDFYEPPRVFLVGVGPGHPGLITRRGLALLRQADIVISDALVNPELLLEARPDAKVWQAARGKGTDAQARKSALEAMVTHATAGKLVVRLKGGDPFLFGRLMEEVEALEEAGIRFDIVPGVSSAFAVPALAGIPLTERTLASSVVLVTGTTAPGRAPVDFRALAKSGDTLVVLMGLGRLGTITEELIAGGRGAETPAAVISCGTVVEQHTIAGTLGDLAAKVAENPVPTPGILVVGDVVRLRERLSLFERRPLFGLKVVVTRARAQSHEFVHSLVELGAKPILFPTIEVCPKAADERGQQAIRSVGGFDGIFFTSANAVRRFFEELESADLDARALAGTKVISVGKATAKALAFYGIRADIIPEKFSQQGILEALGEEGIRGKRFLYPRAAVIEKTLSKAVVDWGGTLEPVVLYETNSLDLDEECWPPEIRGGDFDIVTFTSPSAVRGFEALLGPSSAQDMLRGAKVLAIGKTTARQLKDIGVADVFIPSRSTVEKMLELLIDIHHGDHEDREGDAPGQRLDDGQAV